MSTPIERMYEHFGKDHAHKCKDCDNLIYREQGRRWYKCAVYGVSACAATDWRINQTACGCFNEPYPENMREIKDLYKGIKANDDGPCEGQLELF